MSLRPTLNLHQPRGNVRDSAPGTEPVTLTELKAHLRISGSAEDTLLDSLIATARELLEDTTGLALITQTWTLTLDRWPPYHTREWTGTIQAPITELYDTRRRMWVELPRYPLQSVDSVTVYDEDGNASSVTVASTFDIDTARIRGRMALQVGQTWPVALRAINAVEVGYTAGYGAAATAVPAPLKQAVLRIAAYLYEHRGDCGSAGDILNNSGAFALASGYIEARI